MPEEKDFGRLENSVRQLKQHITEQDAEMFRMSKQIEKMDKRLKQLEGRIKEAGLDAVVDPDRDHTDEQPPHY